MTIILIIAAVVFAFMGLLGISLCIVASRADDEMEKRR